MFAKAPCEEGGTGILCLTYQYNCWAHSRIKPQPVHLHCKNLILCYTFILATDPGTTTTSCVVYLWNIWIFPGYPHGIGITCSIFCGSQWLWDAPSSPQVSTLCTSWWCLASVPAQAECSDRAAGSAALTCPSSCSTVSLLRENYRFFPKRISSHFTSISCRLLVPWGKCSQHSTPHSSLWLVELWVPQIPPPPILLLWMHLLVKTRECN